MLRLTVLGVLTAGAALAAATIAGAEAAPVAVGACVWDKLSEPIRADFLAAYPDEGDDRDLNRAMARLSRYTGAVQVAGRGCTEVNPPELWVIRAVSTHAVRLGSAAVLERQAGLTRAQLDETWRSASSVERKCLRARAGRRFGLKMPACADPEFAKALLRPLKLAGSDEGAQALRYLRATAENEIAEALIARRQEATPGA